MPNPIENFDPEMADYQAHLELHDKRIQSIQEELDAALQDNNEAQIKEITVRLEQAKEEKRLFEQKFRTQAE